jgi:hypothetical protein
MQLNASDSYAYGVLGDSELETGAYPPSHRNLASTANSLPEEHLDELRNDRATGFAFLSLLMGMRHATDPDHVIAVTTIVLSGRD